MEAAIQARKAVCKELREARRRGAQDEIVQRKWEKYRNKRKWPTCMIRSRDTAGGQAPWNCHRKCMESADSAVQRQL